MTQDHDYYPHPCGIWVPMREDSVWSIIRGMWVREVLGPPPTPPGWRPAGRIFHPWPKELPGGWRRAYKLPDRYACLYARDLAWLWLLLWDRVLLRGVAPWALFYWLGLREGEEGGTFWETCWDAPWRVWRARKATADKWLRSPVSWGRFLRIWAGLHPWRHRW